MAIVVLLAVAIPPDNNGYLCAYNNKLALLDTVPQPRIILIGGSNLAFGVDSHRIQDSLQRHVLNMGLHGGIGIRLVLSDVLARLRKGDVLVLAMEYGNFFSGGNGEPETLPTLMTATEWKDMGRLSAQQWQNVVVGMPRLAAANIKRLIRAILGGSLHSPSNNTSYRYVASGFNDLGDEVSHWTLPSNDMEQSQPFTEHRINLDFINWLSSTIQTCERDSAIVVILPPVCPMKHFACCYDPAIAHALDSIGHPYAVDPVAMTVADSCCYNGGYHVNRSGVDINTGRIIALLRRIVANG